MVSGENGELSSLASLLRSPRLVSSALRELSCKGDDNFSDKSSTFDSYFVMPVTRDRGVCLCYEVTFGSSQSKESFSLVLFQKQNRNLKEKIR